MTQPLTRSTADDADKHRLAWTTFPADLSSPVRLFLSLKTAGRHCCLLESVEGPERLARYSFVGIDPVARFRGGPAGNHLETADGTESVPGNSHQALRSLRDRFASPPAPHGLPPFHGGWIGWFAYEWASCLEPRVPRAAADPWEVPEATFDLYHDIVALDHASQLIYAMTACPDGAAGFAAATERLDRIADDLATTPEFGGDIELLADAPKPCMARSDYEAGGATLREAISQGEIFQAVLSQRFEMPFKGDPFTLYRVLRLSNPSPHMFYFEADGLTLVGSSPERLVSVRNGRVENVPIAGTRARHADPVEDERLGNELMADEKERAEHDMLVDLARNDLGRIARLGSVQLREHAVLEKFARVQHIVSRVECDLSSGCDAIDALAACFPAGTVSGAPKVRAMELLAGIEPTTRGPYAGAFGYLDGAGNLDVAIAIRTLAVREGTIHLQAGAGVVFDSVPAKEYEETMHKSSALFDAIRLAGAPAFRTGGGSLRPEEKS